jgi:hypothetical protein
MKTVAIGIDEGVEQVVSDIDMERKYKQAVQGVLRDGLRDVYAQFEAYYSAGAGLIGGGSSAPGAAGDDTAAWAPPIFEEAVCCMQGMPCAEGGEFANAAGRAAILEEMEWRR